MRIKLTILILLLSLSAWSQKSNTEKYGVDKCYTSIEDALAEKDKVECLDLTRQKLKSFPTEILEFKNLKVLILSKNKIEELPAEIGQLDSLHTLVAYRNGITDIRFLAGAPQLKHVDLSDNFIEEIPDEIEQCSSLEYLNLNMNVLAKTSASLGYLPNLKVLDVTENEMTVPVPEIEMG